MKAINFSKAHTKSFDFFKSSHFFDFFFFDCYDELEVKHILNTRMTFELKTGILDRVDGSAELTIGNTKLIVSVTGPIEAKIKQELPTLASLEIIIRPSIGVSSTREKFIEDKLRSILQDVIIRYKYPRQLIQVVVQFLITDSSNQQLIGKSGHNFDYTGNELNAAINGSYFALIDANIEMYSSFASALVSIDEDQEVIKNPNLTKLIEGKSSHLVCFNIKDGKSSKIMFLESYGDFKQEQLIKILDITSQECEFLHNKYQRKFINDKIKQDFIWTC